jgi:glycosyltransferase involved in cell wall biosynthesis
LIYYLGLENNVSYFKPPKNQIPLFYNAADLLCFPSYYEGFGLPALEAMASGCPVIGSSRTSIPEIIGDQGILVDPFDYKTMANWMIDLVQSQGLRTQIAQMGLSRSKRFSWEKSASETMEVYREALQEYRRCVPNHS